MAGPAPLLRHDEAVATAADRETHGRTLAVPATLAAAIVPGPVRYCPDGARSNTDVPLPTKAVSLFRTPICHAEADRCRMLAHARSYRKRPLYSHSDFRFR